MKMVCFCEKVHFRFLYNTILAFRSNLFITFVNKSTNSRQIQ